MHVKLAVSYHWYKPFLWMSSIPFSDYGLHSTNQYNN